MAHYVVCPQKKIISRIFKISGALIVIAVLVGGIAALVASVLLVQGIRKVIFNVILYY
jgi:hypothetical protein